jgi:hypothetical protein
MTFSLWPRSLSIDLGAPKSTPACQVRHFVHHRGHMQQRLGRDAAHVQAHAAQRGVALDQHHLQAQVGRAEGGAVAARAAAQHQHVAVQVGRAAVAGLGIDSRLRLAGCCRCIWLKPAPQRSSAAAAPRLPATAPRSLGDLVAQLDLEFLDHAGVAGRNLHGGLVGLHGDQALLGLDGVATLTSTSITPTSSKSPMSGP